MNLVLLPGLDGTGIMFGPLLREFGDGYQLQTVSYPQDPALGYAELTALVRSQLPKEDLWLLGESFSGPIALTIASERPVGLRGVILCATFVKNPSPIFPTFLAFLVRAPLFSVWPVSAKLNLLTTMRPTDQIAELIRKVKGATTGRVLAARTREALRVNVAKNLEECAFPIMYLGGSRDIVVPRSNLEYVVSLRPDILVRTLSTSHLVLQEAPSRAADEIKAFMESTRQADVVAERHV